MTNKVFDVPIFFIVFRETIEAALIVSVLLSFVEQLMTTGRLAPQERLDDAAGPDDGEHAARVKKLLRVMRKQIWIGTFVGFIIALCIGTAFIVVFYTKLDDLWAKTEDIWEGAFSVIAAIIIYIMGIAFLKMDRSRIKWRFKLAAAFDASARKVMDSTESGEVLAADKKEGRSGRWALFILPLVTVLREGLEAIIFVGGVSLGIPASSIPLPVVCGLIAGTFVGFIIYRTGSSTTLHWFLIGSTTFIFLIGAGLFSKAIGYFQYYYFSTGVGSDVSEEGDGPGSFMVAGNVWHITTGNPETGSATTNGGWQIFNAILGWNNTATLGSVLSYVFYWVLIMITLVYLKWSEGRLTFGGRFLSKAAKRIAAAREERALDQDLQAKRHANDGSNASTGSVPHANEKTMEESSV